MRSTTGQGAGLFRAGLALALLGLGCDPLISVRGRVTAKTGLPAAGATVTVVCPDERLVFRPIAADASGAFRLATLGCLPRACSVRAELDGSAAQRSVGDDCRKTVFFCPRTSCNVVETELTIP